MSIKRIGAFIILWSLITVVSFAGLWIVEWQYVLQNQWIKNPLTHYESWHFIFAPAQAWAWLWYTNFAAWTIWAAIGSAIIGFIAALLISSL